MSNFKHDKPYWFLGQTILIGLLLALAPLMIKGFRVSAWTVVPVCVGIWAGYTCQWLITDYFPHLRWGAWVARFKIWRMPGAEERIQYVEHFVLRDERPISTRAWLAKKLFAAAMDDPSRVADVLQGWFAKSDTARWAAQARVRDRKYGQSPGGWGIYAAMKGAVGRGISTMGSGRGAGIRVTGTSSGVGVTITGGSNIIRHQL